MKWRYGLVKEIGTRIQTESEGGLEKAAPEIEEPAPPPRPGRNDPCPCGSGRKYKRCCGP